MLLGTQPHQLQYLRLRLCRLCHFRIHLLQVALAASHSADQGPTTRQVQRVWHRNWLGFRVSRQGNRKGKVKVVSSTSATFRHWEEVRVSRVARPVLAVSINPCQAMRRRRVPVA